MFNDEATCPTVGLSQPTPTSQEAGGDAPIAGVPVSVEREWLVGPRRFSLDALSALLLLDLAPYLPTIETGVDWSPTELNAAYAKSLRESLLKKYEYDSSEEMDAAALSKFLQVNDTCGEWTLRCESKEDEVLVGELRKQLYYFFYPAGRVGPDCKGAGSPERSPRSMEEIHSTTTDCLLHSFGQFLAEGRCGPGSSRGATASDFYTKLFASPLYYTSEHLYKEYRRYVGLNGPWADAEVLRYSQHGARDRVVAGNKLSFVPKNDRISRCICVEPGLNMFYQLGVNEILCRRLKETLGVDLETQQGKNRDLAQLGSMFDGQWVTIDLSSASDSMSLAMLRSVLPAEPLGFLETLRSKTMMLPDGSELALKMISTMGNGFTFSLQTVLFASTVVAAHRVAGVPIEFPRGSSLGNFGVYGDDIICRTEVHRLVLRLLGLLGFVVNGEKTFVKGPFRESCGGDYWKGHQVRGAYIKRLRCRQDFYVAINVLNRWTMRTGIPLPFATAYLQAFIEGFTLLVPFADADDAGLKVPLHVAARLKRDPEVQAVKYRRYAPAPQRLHVTLCGVYESFGNGKYREARTWNPHGLWVSFLAGYVRDSKVGVRHETTLYRVRTAVTSSWGHQPAFSGIAPEDVHVPFEQAYALNSQFWLSHAG